MLGPRLDLRQSQQLVMTPQLQQAIKLLALTNLEVEGFLAAELERNPLLEASRDEGDEREAAFDGGDGEGEGDGFDAPEPVTADRLMASEPGTTDAPLDVDLVAETFHHDAPSDSIPDGPGLDGGLRLDGAGSGRGAAEDLPDQFEAPPQALADVLSEQAGRALSGIDRVIAAQIIDQITEAGYFEGSLVELAERLGVTLADAERVLAVIQTFEPTGVGARTLAECIAIQAREADRYDPAMACLIANLDLVARGDLMALRRVCDVDAEDLADMLRELRGYNPKPGLSYGGSAAMPVVPDVFVARTAKGWAVELNQATLPRLIVNRSYYAELSAGAGKAERAYLTDCLASANWLIRTLDQRARTIMKVATELVRQQQGFFEQGVVALKPLTLRSIADAIGMHESTVSRVTSNKYLACDRGTFELKYFFTTAIATDGGEAASAEAVRARIRALIAGEPPANPLSDDKLVELLRGEGFDLARRTVAKYREGMGLGSSVQRRRQRVIEAA